MALLGRKKKHRYLFFLSSTDEHIALTVTCYRDKGEGWSRRDDNISHSTQCCIMSGKMSSGILLTKARCFISVALWEKEMTTVAPLTPGARTF